MCVYEIHKRGGCHRGGAELCPQHCDSQIRRQLGRPNRHPRRNTGLGQQGDQKQKENERQRSHPRPRLGNRLELVSTETPKVMAKASFQVEKAVSNRELEQSHPPVDTGSSARARDRQLVQAGWSEGNDGDYNVKGR